MGATLVGIAVLAVLFFITMYVISTNKKVNQSTLVEHNTLRDKVNELSKWTTDISEVYNRNKEKMLNDIVGLVEWTKSATTVINESNDDIYDLQVILLEQKVTIALLEQKLESSKNRVPRVIITNYKG